VHEVRLPRSSSRKRFAKNCSKVAETFKQIRKTSNATGPSPSNNQSDTGVWAGLVRSTTNQTPGCGPVQVLSTTNQIPGCGLVHSSRQPIGNRGVTGPVPSTTNQTPGSGAVQWNGHQQYIKSIMTKR